MNWPESTEGKKSCPSHGANPNEATANAKNSDEEDPGVIDAKGEQAQVTVAKPLEAGFKAELEARERVAARRASSALSASSCSWSRYLAIVGTRVRERKKLASMAKTTASAMGTNR